MCRYVRHICAERVRAIPRTVKAFCLCAASAADMSLQVSALHAVRNKTRMASSRPDVRPVTLTHAQPVSRSIRAHLKCSDMLGVCVEHKSLNHQLLNKYGTYQPVKSFIGLSCMRECLSRVGTTGGHRQWERLGTDFFFFFFSFPPFLWHI